MSDLDEPNGSWSVLTMAMLAKWTAQTLSNEEMHREQIAIRYSSYPKAEVEFGH